MKKKVLFYLFVINVLFYCILNDSVTSKAAEYKGAGNDFHDATVIEANGVQFKNILEEKSDRDEGDYYSFTTGNKNSWYKISLANAGSNAMGVSLYSDDDSTSRIDYVSVSETNISNITLKLQPNHTYYVKVHSDFWIASGMYKFTLSEIIDDEVDDFRECSSLILGKKYERNLEENSDVDYFKFKTTNQDSFYTIALSNLADGDMEADLYSVDDSTGKVETISAYSMQTGRYSTKLKKNYTYYVAVHSNKYSTAIGKYKLSVTETKDDVGDTVNNSTKLTINTTKKGTLNAIDDIDVYTFKTESSSAYNVKLANISSDSNMKISVYSGKDLTSDQYITSISYISKSEASSKSVSLKKNSTYYVIIEGNDIGNYKITITDIKKNLEKIKAKISISSSEYSITINWKEVYLAQGYEIYRSTKKNGKFELITTVSNEYAMTYSQYFLSKGTYYYKVRAYSKVGEKTYYSKFSEIKYVKVK